MTIFNSGYYYLNLKYLEGLANRYRNAYRQASPFPHIVIDDFLPPEVLEQVLDELSTLDSCEWQQGNSMAESKITNPEIARRKHNLLLTTQAGNITHWLLNQLNSATFVSFLEQLTGIEGLLPNPHVESIGLPVLASAKPFKMQADRDRYIKSRDRKLTFLIYLNKNWQEEYGGHLELWNAEMSHCEKKILPGFNRCVIFSTTDFSYYGHPEPLNCPDDETRKLLALYYYSKEQEGYTIDPSLSPSVFHTGDREIIKPEKQPAEALVKTLLKRLIPAFNRI